MPFFPGMRKASDFFQKEQYRKAKPPKIKLFFLQYDEIIKAVCPAFEKAVC